MRRVVARPLLIFSAAFGTRNAANTIKKSAILYAVFIMSVIVTTASAEPTKQRWLFRVLATWNLLLAISFPIQANILTAHEGFYYRSIWFSLPTEMIGFYPHLGYLIAWWPSRLARDLGFSPIPWDCSGVAGASFIVVSSSALLAIALFFRKRWAGYIAAFVALLVAATQFQQVHFPRYHYDLHIAYEVLHIGMATGAFEKLIASVVSAIVALSLFRLLVWENMRRETGSTPASPIGHPRDLGVQQTAKFLFAALVLLAILLLVLAGTTPSNWNKYYGENSGFSIVFQLLLLVPVGAAAGGVWAGDDRFFVGLGSGCAMLLPVVLFGTWDFVYSQTLFWPLKAAIWIAVVICFGIVAGAVSVIWQGQNVDSMYHERFSLGVITSLAFFATSLDACHMHFSSTGLLRK